MNFTPIFYPQNDSAFKPCQIPQDQEQNNPPIVFDIFNFVTDYQNFLIQNMLNNQVILRNYLTHTIRLDSLSTEEEKPKENELKSAPNVEKKNSGFFQRETKNTIKKEKYPILERKLRKKKKIRYEFDEDQMGIGRKGKQCETKNIIKNYSKYIINFIEENTEQKEKILKSLNVDVSEFDQNLKKIKGNIYSIVELREFWTTSKFSKVFRIFSEVYLRKHSLNHIFNSRIQKLPTHLKYRKRLLKGVHNPEDFTIMKEF